MILYAGEYRELGLIIREGENTIHHEGDSRRCPKEGNSLQRFLV